MAIAGRVAIVPKGVYVNGKQYKRLDLVTYNDDGYVAKLDNINVVPEDGDTWMLAWHGAAADVTERISNLENLILPANTALNKNFETDASAYKENGTASVGTSENISRSDHVHPTDQTRLSKDGDSQNNTVTFTSNDASTSDAWTDVTVLASKEKHSSLFGKISTMFKNVRYIYTHFIKSENILETLEEIVANTQSGKVAGALAVKELNSSLTEKTLPETATNAKAFVVFATNTDGSQCYSSSIPLPFANQKTITLKRVRTPWFEPYDVSNFTILNGMLGFSIYANNSTTALKYAGKSAEIKFDYN